MGFQPAFQPAGVNIIGLHRRIDGQGMKIFDSGERIVSTGTTRLVLFPDAPKPGAPQPGAPQPGAPKPGAPEPGAPKPGAPR